MYESLFTIRKNQDKRTAFAFFPINLRGGEDFDSPFEDLAKLAKNEDWSYHDTDSDSRFPVLRNYLNHTFLRLQETGKIKIAEGGKAACFNTGLQTPENKDIFALFKANEEAHAQEWVFRGFYESYSHHLDSFYPRPDIAQYISNTQDLIFDSTLEIDMNLDHIYNDNKDRLPASVRDNKLTSLTALRGAVEDAKAIVRRNYKAAIPVWYRGKVDLLLPAYITNHDKPDFAFVTEKVGQFYKIPTILSMDFAYNNARLIARPDRDWLVP